MRIRMNSEIRIKQKHLLIGFVALFIVFIFIITRKCSSDVEINEKQKFPIIYAITPTYARAVQKAELTRLSQVFQLVPNLFWVIVEDAAENTILVRNLLDHYNLANRSVLLHAQTPINFKLKGKDNWTKPRGVEQRNKALEWVKKKLRENQSSKSVVYFMDDDNTYSTDLFSEMNKIEQGRVAVWPVGLVGGLYTEKPILKDNIVVGFNSLWRPERPFPVDMAGFAISGDLFLKYPEAVFSFEVERGYQETEILRHLTTLSELQPLANMCREILVWHTRTETPKIINEKQLKEPSNTGMIL